MMEATLVHAGVSTHWIDTKMSIIKAVDCQNKDKEDSFFESKLLKGLLLVMKHASSSKQAQKIYSGSMYHFNNNMPKRQKVTNAASYDRLFIFADMMDPPNCFAIISNTTSQSYKYMEHSTEVIGIGKIFYIVEPRRSVSTLGQKLPLISSTKPLIPLKYSVKDLTMKENITACNMMLPKEPGEMLYFASHGVKVTISHFEVDFKEVSCTGIFCDRNQLKQANVSCGCMYEGEQGACVAEYTLTIPSLSKISNNHDTESIEECRSLRTTRLFFKDLAAFGQQTLEKAQEQYISVRLAVKTMVEYVNTNGGWTVVGWFKKGEVEDSSNLQGEKVESTSCTLHVSLLIPTNENISKGTDDAFNNMKISTDETVS
jgi:hypothetical protein